MDVITFPENRLTTSGLQILLHGVISLTDATSYDKRYIINRIIHCVFIYLIELRFIHEYVYDSVHDCFLNLECGN